MNQIQASQRLELTQEAIVQCLAVKREFLKHNEDFEIDTEIDTKLLVSVAPCGYLKRIK